MMQKLDIRAVALDMDGTLLGPDHQVSSYTLKILNTLLDRDIACIIATGRSVGVLKTGGQLPSRMYAVCLNGAQLAHLDQEQPLEERFLPEFFATAVSESFASFSYHLHAYVGEKLWCENANMQLLGKYGPQFQKLKIFEHVKFSECERSHILKFVTAGEKENLQPIIQELRQRLEAAEPGSSQYLYANFSMPGIMEIQDARMSKGLGLKNILKYMGLSTEQLMAIGDGYNDEPMWQVAKVPVVMGNAFADLKQKGYYQAPSNADDGAAQFLRAWFHLS